MNSRSNNDPVPDRPPTVAVGYPEEVAGKGPLHNRIARLVSHALRDARRNRDLSRADVAQLMTKELGRKVSEGTLEAWASEADLNHRIPLDAFIALVAATGAVDLLGSMPGFEDFVVVPRKYMAVINLHLLEEFERDLAEQKAQLLADVRALR